MGSSSSKFKKYLQHGDEFAAMQVFQGSPELRKNLDPNLSYGEHHSHNTALHYAAKHGMKHLLRTFLIDLGIQPSSKITSRFHLSDNFVDLIDNFLFFCRWESKQKEWIERDSLTYSMSTR